MGPRLFSRGNDEDGECEWLGMVTLQWGHDFSAVEMVFNYPRFYHSVSASMGPRLFSRGNVIIYHIYRFTHFASMGPRLFSRGNYILYQHNKFSETCFNGATTFQPWK